MKAVIPFLFIAVLTNAQPAAPVSPDYKLADLSFMAGSWKTSSDWGEMDEVWSAPLGNCMMCSYRCVKNGKAVFYEFVLIEQNESDPVPVMKLRHFNPGSIGWEDKTNPYLYPLVELTGKKATFQGGDKKTTLSYERVNESTLKAVLVRDKDGQKSTTEFIFTRN